jgi:hypothetical protein
MLPLFVTLLAVRPGLSEHNRFLNELGLAPIPPADGSRGPGR